MSIRLWSIALGSIGLSAVAQLLMKIGMGQLRLAGLSGVNLLGGAASNLYVIGGFAAYGIGAVLWLLVLSRVDLSIAYPLVSVGFVLVAALSWIVLGEHLTAARLAAIFLIVIGVLLMGYAAR
jgi:multidrug transporter EmrE-like cation transporter